jgi:hypothetical protein
MPQKFGNYLFKNLKGQQSDSSQKEEGCESLKPLEEQIIELKREDFLETSYPPLKWEKISNEPLKIQLKDTRGIMEGRVSIPAITLRKLEKQFVDNETPDDAEYPVSLKTVVLQIQGFLKKKESEIPKPIGPDFDTPIAQVAREDEGFFKLEKAAGREALPSEKEASDTTFPLIREKALPPEQIEGSIQERPEKLEGPRPIPITIPTVASKEKNPFADLPKIETSKQSRSSNTAKPSGIEKKRGVPQKEERKNKPLYRFGLERLQEIFMTDDFLDAQQVASQLANFPKVKGVLVMLEEGTWMGGQLPPYLNQEAALMAPGLLRAVKEFSSAVTKSETAGITILSEIQMSIFMEGKVCLFIVHEGRGLLPGMRDRMIEIAKALDAIYDAEKEN